MKKGKEEVGENGKTGLVRVHGWQGTRVTLVNYKVSRASFTKD
jgi:hypothetical protein